MNRPATTTLTVFAVYLLACEAPLFAQGDLAPPGPPAPIMKTLEQGNHEPRSHCCLM